MAQDERAAGSYDGPPLTPPELARPIVADGEHAYRARRSAERQAERWNQILELDPLHGPANGFRVGVAPVASEQHDGRRFELIWIPTAAPAVRRAEESAQDRDGEWG